MNDRLDRLLALAWIPLATLGLAQLALWAPHAVLRPWWADHDVFGTMALGWDRGLLPYRDLLGNNFPGTIYLFWLAGKLFGWGETVPFLATDVALLVGFLGLLLAWGRRVFGRLLPGTIGALAVLSVYLGLDYSLTAQRDWQAPLLGLAGLLAVQAYPGRIGRLLGAGLLALGFSIRPQVVLLGPAYLAALATGERGGPRTVAGFGLTAAAGVGLLFLPLAWHGLLGDFLAGLRVVGAGGGYGDLGARAVLGRLARQTNDAPLPLLGAVALATLAAGVEPSWRRPTWTWVAATLGLALYLPLSPVEHPYLKLPLQLAWAVDLAMLAGLAASARGLPPAWRACVLLLVVGAGVVPRPAYCNLSASRAGVAALLRGEDLPEWAPPGYRRDDTTAVEVVPWADYRATLDHLRTRTGPETRVANVLKGVALCGPAARLPAFPAESATWLAMVRPGDEPRFVAALEAAADSVVVWSPGQTGPASLDRFASLRGAILRLYRPEFRSGSIEVWRRIRPSDAAATRP